MDEYEQSSGDAGEIVYLDNDGEALSLDVVGEDIVFEVVSSFLGERPDSDDELFETSADVYTQRSLLMRIFGR